MSEKKFNQKEYQQKYYQEHKAELNKRRAMNAQKKKFVDTLTNVDIDKYLIEVRDALIKHDETDESPANQKRFIELVNYANFFMWVKRLRISPEDKLKVSLHEVLDFRPVPQ